MIKVFLVEDEIIMRDGIKKNIDWQGNGFEFVGEASDGELAYPMIQKEKPDILITDIKMPFMDGLELSRLVKAELPDIKIMILSGHEEFEYAKEAISIGITDYLLKPITGAKLLEAVKKVAKSIEEEREQKMYLKQFEKERLENAQYERVKFFKRLTTEKLSVTQILESGKECGMDMLGDAYNIVLFQLYPADEMEESNEIVASLMAQIESDIEEMDNVLLVKREDEGWVFIVKELNGISTEECLKELYEQLKVLISDYPQVEYFGGVGEEVKRLSEFAKSYEAARKAFAYRFFKKHNQIVFSSEAVQPQTEDHQHISLSMLSSKQVDRKVVAGFLKSGLSSEIDSFVDSYFEGLGEQNMQSLIFRQYTTMDTYMTTVSVLEQIGYSSKELVERVGDYETMAAVFSEIEETKNYLRRIFECAIELRDAVSKKKYSSLLQEAIDYIQDNFSNEEISLNQVAGTVGLSPTHFSTVFSQEMGKTFIEYLTEVRMEKAKELIKSTGMKVAEIANEVGYKDPHYFSYLFKKTQDCTPREYKSKN